jgi:YggT family protein
MTFGFTHAGFSVPHLIADLLQLLSLVVLIDVVISYMLMFRANLSPYHPFVRLVRRIVTPILEPIRRALPPNKTNNLDFSPMVVMIAIQVICSILYHM